MYEFSFRVTGDAANDAEVADKFADYVKELVLSGCNVAHASLNGREIHVHIDRVEITAKDPDRWLFDMDAKIKEKLAAATEPAGETTS